MKTALKIMALLVLGSFSMSAQLSRGFVVQVPFDFTAGNKSLPAGEYRVFAGPADGVVAIRSIDGTASCFIMSQATKSLNPHPESRLVFNRYGSRYFLSKIHVQGNPYGVLFRPTRTEVEAARRLVGDTESVIASTKSKP